MNKYQAWWDSLTPHTREYLNNQPIWYDRDLYKALGLGITIGLVIGLIL